MNISEKTIRFGKNIWKIVKRYPHSWFVLGMLLLSWAVWVNLFPEGYIISGGDVLQLLRAHENFWFLHYGWTGRVSLFYALFYILDTLGVSETGQLSWYLGVFLFGSYISFYAFTRLVFTRASSFVAAFIALLYATNVYTLYVFTSTWGYTHYQILYVFIPALTGLYMRALLTRDMMWVYVFLLVAFLSSGGSFGNPAFAFSLALYFIFLTFGLLIFQKEWFTLRTVGILGVIALGAVLLNIYWIAPLVPQVRSGIAGVSLSTDIVLSDALQKTSNAISDTIRLVQTAEKDIYYPYNFPYQTLPWLKSMLPVIAFIPFFIVLFGIFVLQDKNNRKQFSLFFLLFVLFIFLVARVRFPFETVNNFLFQLPGFNVLRGYDKTGIYTPFLLLALVTSMMVMLQQKRVLFYVTVLTLSIYGVLMALPFYFGGIQTEMSYIFANDGKKNFQSSKYSALIKLPKEYYDIQKIIDADTSDGKVARLPFSEGSSIGRVNLPRLRINSPAPERYMYTKEFIDPNEIYFLHWRFGEDLENTSYNPQWIVDMYGVTGAKYIVYHKDAKPESLDKMNNMMDFLGNTGSISLVSDNSWLALYRIDDRYVFPHAYVISGADTSMQENVSGIMSKAHVLRDHVTNVLYVKNRDKSMEVVINSGNVSDDRVFVLSERYDTLWRAEFVDASGKSHLLERDERVVYGNGWKLGDKDQEGKIIIHYLPVELFYKGMWASGMTLVLVVIGLGVTFVKRRNRL